MDEDDLIDLEQGTVESVFADFHGRRAGLLKALTVDADLLFEACDPRDESLCLYGNPNGTWRVSMPSVIEILPETPDPTPGINFVRDDMTKTRWLSFVANYCDTWLLCVAFHNGALCGFNRIDRERLFRMINTFPSLRQAVSRQALSLAPELRGFWMSQNARARPRGEGMPIQMDENAEANGNGRECDAPVQMDENAEANGNGRECDAPVQMDENAEANGNGRDEL